MKPSLCLNMVVKNEGDRIERALVSVLPYVKAAAILDTGSTDATKDIIKDVCARMGVPVVVRDGAFIDFSQARNLAFKVAQDARDVLPWCNFVLLMDADMELVVVDNRAFDGLDANALSYDMMQKGGAISYGNRRLLNLSWGQPPYVGVTHEYLDVPAAGMIAGASFIDHADGSNRADKYPRDAALLEAALKKEPENGRYWYYLGNTYRDWGRPIEAIAAYEKRIALGGWDEETHSAMMNKACCWKDRGDEEKYTHGLMEAYAFRPQRAEPLYDLAKYWRESGKPAIGALIAEGALAIKRPNDMLFVNDFVYEHGLKFELSVSGFYIDGLKHKSMALTDELALDPSCPHEYKGTARGNLFWHTKPLGELCKTFEAKKLDFIPPHGYTALNPSVVCENGNIRCNIRTVNYRIDSEGYYTIDGVRIYDKGPAIDTRNFLVHLDWNDPGVTHNPSEILWDRPTPIYPAVTGLEDIRLWHFNERLYLSATVREQSPTGCCDIWTGRLDVDFKDPRYTRVADAEMISDGVSYEKNWMPVPRAKAATWMHRLDRVATRISGETIHTKHPTPIDVSQISGSSQVVMYGYGYLAVTHEASSDPNTGKRTYWHRFAYFDEYLKLKKLSRPFVFFERQIEFCSGLAVYRGGKMLLSFGVRDEEAWIATIEDWEIDALLQEGPKV